MAINLRLTKGTTRMQNILMLPMLQKYMIPKMVNMRITTIKTVILNTFTTDFILKCFIFEKNRKYLVERKKEITYLFSYYGYIYTQTYLPQQIYL